MSKYEKGKGKAFSYFSIVAKHWFILDNNTTYRRFKKHVEICEQTETLVSLWFNQNTKNKKVKHVNLSNSWSNIGTKNVGKYFTKDRDLKIANAVVEIFRNADRIDIFNKKALYLYIREIADCQTQHITKVINKLMEPQRKIREEYYNTGKITGIDA